MNQLKKMNVPNKTKLAHRALSHFWPGLISHSFIQGKDSSSKGVSSPTILLSQACQART